MTLNDYLAQPGQTATKLASATGSAVSTITRAAKGAVLPSRELMLKIFTATGGRVTPNDFFGIAIPLHEDVDTAAQQSAETGKTEEISPTRRAAA